MLVKHPSQSQLIFTVDTSRTVFFNLFEVAEPKMTSKTSWNPNDHQKTLRNPKFSKLTKYLQ